jgi:DeoR family transcriptional regulator of aga operon
MRNDERRKHIVELVRQKGNVTMAQLQKALPNVSEITLRRDLETLDKERQLVRIRGGAKSLESILSVWEDSYSNRMVSNLEEKQDIARKAAALIMPKTSIYLDSGSTAFCLASLIPDFECVITTTGITCALELSKLRYPLVQMPGGFINKNSFSLNGDTSVTYLDHLNFNIAFLGVTGYIPGKYFVTSVAEDYMLKRTVMKSSQKVVVLMDSSKLDKLGAYTIARLDEVSTVVTDGHMDRDLVIAMERKGITVL